MKSKNDLSSKEITKNEQNKEAKQKMQNQKEEDSFNSFKFFTNGNFEIIRSRIKSQEDFKKQEVFYLIGIRNEKI